VWSRKIGGVAVFGLDRLEIRLLLFAAQLRGGASDGIPCFGDEVLNKQQQ